MKRFLNRLLCMMLCISISCMSIPVTGSAESLSSLTIPVYLNTPATEPAEEQEAASEPVETEALSAADEIHMTEEISGPDPMMASSGVDQTYTTLSGSVVDGNGAGMEQVSVFILNAEDNSRLVCVTDATGAWQTQTYDIVVGGTYYVTYYKSGYSFQADTSKPHTAVESGNNLGRIVASLQDNTEYALKEEDYTYTATDTEATITGYTGSDTKLQLPSSLGGVPVSAVGSSAFLNRTAIEALRIPDGISSIGNSAFEGCSALKSVVFPATLRSIGTSAFARCTSLPEAELPDGVRSIGRYAFQGCTSLSAYHYPLHLNSTGYRIFENCSKLSSITVPEGVTFLPANVFDFCNCITSVTLPSTLTSIGSSAFVGCSSLTSIQIPDGVTSIGSNAFQSCRKLSAISWPSTLTTIGTYAFEDCPALTEVNLPDSVQSIGRYAFANCTGITSYHYPLSLTSTGYRIFENCSKLGSITVPEGVTSLPANVFDFCSCITSVTLPSTLISIGGSAFVGCSSLTSIQIPDGVTAIGNNAFERCTGLTELNLPDSVESIGRYAFANCTAVTSYHYPLSLTSTGYRIFENCPKLTSITVPEGVTALPASVFDNCSYLKSVTLPSTLTSIGSNAFAGCTSLRRIILPESVESISSYAFASNSHLTHLYMGEKVNSIHSRAFDGSSQVTVYGVGGSYAQTYADQHGLAFTDGTTASDTSRLSGKVTDADGTAVPGVGVFITNQEEGINLTCTTDETGSWQTAPLDIVEGYTYQVTFFKSGYFFDSTATATVTALASGNSLGTVTCTILSNSDYVQKEEDFTFTATETEATITGYKGSDTKLLLPASFGSIPVTSIGANAFQGNKSLEALMIPGGIRSIGSYAFDGCTGLKSVVFPSTLQSIGKYAFNRCSSLAEAQLPDGVHNIGIYAFANCTALSSYHYPVQLTSSGYRVFENCTSLSSITVPEGVTSLPANVFDFCNCLNSVTLPSTLTSIGTSAFVGCSSLESIQIPEGVTSIGREAFNACSKLSSVSYPSTLTSIGISAFESCVKLTRADLPDSVQSIGNYAFRGCTGITSYHYPMSLTSTGYRIFENCTGLTEITVPEGITFLPGGVFDFCNYLRTVTLPSTLTSIGTNAFVGCTSMRRIILPESVESIGNCAFGNNAHLTHVYMGESVKSIHNKAFDGSPNVSIYGVSGSYAETFASQYSLPFIAETTLLDSSVFSGTVKDADGNALADASVYLRNQDEGTNWTYTTDENGHWQTAPMDIVEGFTYRVSYYKTGYTFPEDVCVTVTALSSGNDLGTVSGTLIDSSEYVLNADNYTFTKTETSATITGYTGSDTKLELPSSLGGVPVTAIANNAFARKSGIEAILIPDGVRTIGSGTFAGCAALRSVIFPATLESIGSSAFENCTRLNEAILPDGVKSIGRYAFTGCTGLAGFHYPLQLTEAGYQIFANCSSLDSISVPEGVTALPAGVFDHANYLKSVTLPSTLTSIGGNAFTGCISLESIRIPDGVTSIGNSAFENCTKLSSVSWSSTLATIGNSAFAGCTALTEVNLPDSVQSIGRYAFANCTGITSYHYPLSLTSTGYRIFENCSALTSITVPEGVTFLPANVFDFCNCITSVTLPSTLTSIGGSAFVGCSALTSIQIPEGVTSIGNSAFENCTKLSSISWPSTLTTIGNSAFAGCTALTEVNLPDSVQSIGRYAFTNCTGITSYHYPLSLTSTGYRIFENCSALTSITVPEGVTFLPANVFDFCNCITSVTLPSTLTSIGGSAFVGCSALESIQIPEGVTSIGNSAFENCTKLSSISWPSALTTIGNSAFAGCTALTEVNLPDSVQTIGRYAFANCTAVTSCHYPLSLTSAGYRIFENCSALTGITVPEGVTALPGSVFDNCSYLKSVTLPSTLTSIGGNAFIGCSGLESIQIPDGVTSIGNSAFEGCTALTELNLPDSVQSIGRYAFAGCTAVTSYHYPLSLTSTGYRIFENCSSLKTITIPEGIKAIPGSAFSGANCLRVVELPVTLTSIGANAFENCAELRFLHIPTLVKSIGRNAFANHRSDFVLYTAEHSAGPIYALENNISFILEQDDEIDPSTLEEDDISLIQIFAGSGTLYFASMDTLSVNGCVSCSVQYEITDEAFGRMSRQSLMVSIPDGFELMEATLSLNSTLLTNYTISDRYIIVPVSGKKGTLRFTLHILSGVTSLSSYAFLRFQADGTERYEMISQIHETFSVLTLNAPDIVSSEPFTVNGTAPAGSQVQIMLDDAPCTTVTASMQGWYEASLTLTNPEPESDHIITAQTEDPEGKILQASRMVSCQAGTPELKNFVMYYNNHKDTSLNLLDPSQTSSNIFFNPAYPMTFTLKIDNNEAIDRVYVTSTRNNVKHSIEAVYDAKKGLYVASGYFNPDQRSYVPGTIGVEYSLKHADARVSDSLDLSRFTRLDSSVGSVISSTDSQVETTVDLGKVAEELSGVNLETTLKIIDLENGTTFEDLYGHMGQAETVLSYIVPGLDDEKYIVNLDFTDPKTILMVVADASDGADQVFEVVMNYKDVSDKTFGTLFDVGEKLSNVALLSKTAYQLYGIYEDHNDLVSEINTSSTIRDKAGAIRKAEELRSDRVAFLLLTTAMPLLIAGGPMTAPAILFTALLGTITATSSLFWDLRIADIKGQKIKAKWTLDPSGYIYEAVTTNRLEGVQAAAYWVPYDENDPAFWDKAPEDGAGVLWDAADWNQINPVLTDSEGRYQWDVPEGWWQVRFTKEGYQNMNSIWMCVAPPQTEVNLPMVSLEAPVWESVSVHHDSLVLTSSRYLKPESISGLTLADSEGNSVAYTAQWPTDETSMDGTVYARTFTLLLQDTELEKYQKLLIHVPEETISSYADVYMAPSDLEAVYMGEKNILADSSVTVQEDGETVLTVQVENHESGDVLQAVSTLSNTAKVESVSAIDENGQAKVTLKGIFSGTCQLILTLAGTDVSVTVPVVVQSGDVPDPAVEHDGFRITLRRGGDGTGFVIESSLASDTSVLLICASYKDNQMTDFSVTDASVPGGGEYEGTIAWDTGNGMPLYIMLWQPDTLIPVTAPFVFE